MRIGTIVFGTDTGLGNQTKAFYDHMAPYKSLLVDLKKFNGMEVHSDWYTTGNVRRTAGIPLRDDFEWLIDGVDILFFCEAPLNYQIYDMASRRGVPSVQQYNYEFLDFLNDDTLTRPTIFAAPSVWRQHEVESKFGKESVRLLRVPVDLSKLHFRPNAEEVPTVVHIVGRAATHDRNGTLDYLDSIKYLPTNFRHIIYAQNTTPTANRKIQEYTGHYQYNVELRGNVTSYAELYSEGDVLVLPRRYGGLCLPMQEALSAGMPVIMTDISPNNEVLPKEWLVPATVQGAFTGRSPIEVYEVKPEELAAKIRSVIQEKDSLISHKSLARELARGISWDVRKNEYLSLFHELTTNNGDINTA